MVVHLVDGTYELFRQFYGRRRGAARDDRLGAVSGVLHSLLQMVEEGATHLGVATDHVIESFRNDLWPGYKTGAGVDPALRAQFEPLEEGLAAMGIAVWPMVELEADDALAAAARIAAADDGVEQVRIWTPDKDLAQCVRGDRVVQIDRRAQAVRNEAGVREKFGVPPALIPDFLALVGDSADGYPGVPGIGRVTAARLVNQHGELEKLPVLRARRRPACARAPVQGPGDAQGRGRPLRRRRRPALARADARLARMGRAARGRAPGRAVPRGATGRVTPKPLRPAPTARRHRRPPTHHPHLTRCEILQLADLQVLHLKPRVCSRAADVRAGGLDLERHRRL